tara:strand:- start:428 stop:1198 length:771 start_codon:yes stop_codon:yes gene_type:complete
MSEQKYAFPTEVLTLPSKGLLYPKDHPLSSGTIDVKYMTAKEEDILTSSNLIEKGTVVDRLLESVIADPKIKLDDILIGDKNALMIGTRVLGYGPEYTVKFEDPDTTLEVEHTFNLTQLTNVDIDYKLLESGKNEFKYELPKSGDKLTFKLLTNGDEKNIDKEIKAYKKLTQATGVDNSLTTRMKYQITSINGDTKQETINDFVDNKFLSLDTREYRKYVKSVTPDINLKQEYESQVGETHTVDIPIGIRFFWPDT